MEQQQTIWIKFSDLSAEQRERIGIAGRMRSSGSDEMPLSLDEAKKLGLSEAQMNKARVELK